MLACAALSSILTALAAYIIVMTLILQPLRKEAVDRGLASWAVTNNSTGETKFVWNEINQTIHAANPDMFDEIAKPLTESK